MKIKSLILCLMVFVTESIVAQQQDLFIKKDGSIVVKGTAISKDTSGFYIIPQSERMALRSIAREQSFSVAKSIQVSYNEGNKIPFGKLQTDNVFKQNMIIIAPDTTTQIVWGEDLLKLKLQSQPPTEDEPVNIACDLVLKRNSIVLAGRTLPISNTVFFNDSNAIIIVRSLKLETPYDDKRDVIVTQIGDTIEQLYKAEGKSLLSKSESLFSIQPGTKIQIAWGDHIWVIDNNTHSPKMDWPVKFLSIIAFLLLMLALFGWKYSKQIVCKRQIKRQLSDMEEKISSIMPIEDESDFKRGTDSEPSKSEPSKNESIKEIITSLGTKIERLKYPDYIALNHFMKLCENRDEIKKTLDNGGNEDYTFENILDRLEEKLLNFNSMDHVVEKPTREGEPQQKEDVEKYPHGKCIETRLDKNVDDTCDNVRLEPDANNKEIETLVEKIATRLEELVETWMPDKGVLDNLSKLDSELRKSAKEQLALLKFLQGETDSTPIQNEFGGKTVEEINTIINAVEGLIGKYQKNTSKELETAIECSIIKKILYRIQLNEKHEKYACLKDLIDSIKKSDNADKLTNTLLLGLNDVYLELDKLTEADNNRKDVEKKVIDEIKEQCKKISGAEFFSANLFDAIKYFVGQVKGVVDQKNQDIADLTTAVGRENDIIEEIKDELTNNQKNLKYIYQSYIYFIVSAFEQIENNVRQSCNAQDESAPLVEKIHKHIISNDYYGLSDLLKRMKEVGTDIDELKEEIKLCLKNPSWIDVLTQMYLYIQVPALAQKLTALGLNTAAVNKAFCLTEFVMNGIGIKLKYPKLFTDTFDGSDYKNEALSEIQDLVGDISDLVGVRPHLIIDLLKVGYSEDGDIKQKAVVVPFN